MRLALLAVAALVSAPLSAQGPPFPVPEYDEVFYRYDRAANKLIELERQVGAAESRPKALGFAGYRVSYYLRGSHSPVRFREGEPLEFVFSLPERVDPHTVQFLVLRISGTRREFTQLQSNRPSLLGPGAAKDVSERSVVSYEIQKQGESTFRLLPSRVLRPGEYTLSLSTNNVAYSFGIDAADRPGTPK